MSIDTTAEPAVELYDGAVMTLEEFLQACEDADDRPRCELIEGVVRMSFPSLMIHDNPQSLLIMLAKLYQGFTAGTNGVGTPTVLVAPNTLFQPDVILRRTDDVGGQSRARTEQFIDGSPEFIIEVSNTSRAFDLNQKREAYARHGVREYLVADVQAEVFRWFDLTTDQERSADADGILRAVEFPGFWINMAAVFRDDVLPAMLTLNASLASPEHAAFVAELARGRTPTDGGA